jgi:two-component SAPR family response regulator
LAYKILLVDDEPNVLSGYRRTLESYLKVYVATSGFEGIAILESQGPFALVIVDYSMPNMDGIDFLLQAKIISPATVRIMLTGKADLAVAMEAVNQGNIYKFITKPCKADFLLDIVITGVEEYRSKQEESQLVLISSEPGKDHSQNSVKKMVSAEQTMRSDNRKIMHEGQKKLYRGLTCWEKEKYLDAYEYLLKARDIFCKIRAFGELARTNLYLAGLGLNLSKDETGKDIDIAAYIKEGLKIIREHQLTSIYLTEGTYLIPVFKWALENGLGTDYLLEVLKKLGVIDGEKYVSVLALGPLKVQRGNEVVLEKNWRNPKIKHFFFFLLTYRYKKIDREVLLDTFWPDKAPDAAANNLSSLLYYLRKVVGHNTIFYEKGLCWLNTKVVWCDAFVYEENIKAGNKYLTRGYDLKAKELFQEAIALYQGDFLEEYLYEDWLERERQRLQSLYIETLINLAKLWAKTGQHHESILLLKKVPLNDFYADRVVSLLVEYLILSGKKSEAKDIYLYYKELYRAELGLELIEEKSELFNI